MIRVEREGSKRYVIRRTRYDVQRCAGIVQWTSERWSGKRGWVPFDAVGSRYHTQEAAWAVAETLRAMEALEQ
jgi:hypothetical protein